MVLVFASLLLAAVLMFGVILSLEGATDLARNPGDWLDRLRPESALDMLSNAAEVLAGVLAVAITVVAIVVELAANRYTHRITQLFVRERVNIGVMALFVVTTVLCLWVGGTFAGELPGDQSFTYAGLVIVMGLVTICLLVLLPYFGFVFSFLSPPNVIANLQGTALRSVDRAIRGNTKRHRAQVIESVDELEDVARGAMNHGDRGIGMAAVAALGGLLAGYNERRANLPDDWFEIDGEVATDPDFVSLAATSVSEIRRQQSWLEYKVLRQLHGLYMGGLGASGDLCDRIAVEAFRIGDLALHGNDEGGVENSIRAFNSFMRAAINAGDLRSAYFVLDQYRSLAESALRRDESERVLEISDHLIEYGRFGQQKGQHFLVEVVAYDLVQLILLATESSESLVRSLLARLLSVDEVAGEETTGKLRGVRRAQVQLGVFFLARGDDALAEAVQKDMAGEDPLLLRAIRGELETEDRHQFWEFTDRGINFSYLPHDQRAFLAPFFAALEQRRVTAPRAS